MVECGGLENHCTERYRGFESLSLRKEKSPASESEQEFLYLEGAFKAAGFQKRLKNTKTRPQGGDFSLLVPPPPIGDH